MTQLIKRDVLLKYRGAFFGVLWAFLNPLILLAVFTFVFGHIFPSRWPVQGAELPNAVMLFAGLMTFNLFANSIARAPESVRGYPSYVKKIIFPLEILPMVPMGSALVYAGFNLLILVGALAWFGQLHWQLLLLPVLVLPLLLLTLGLTWFLAAWGVFIKDMSQIVPVFVQLLMFMSPVFYPANAVPAILQPFFRLNPLAPALENVRAAIVGAPVLWGEWSIALGMAAVVFLLGFAFFQHSRDEFADVL
ncbi:MAG: ABC transporter permease [Gallionellaceae bacterium]|nr:ABC transporter permease [Gallionellaceae bacterium]